MQETTGRAAVERLLRKTADRQTRPRRPRGCLVVQGALACGDESEPVRRQLIRQRAKVLQLLRRRFQQAKENRELGRAVDVRSLARFYTTFLHGMSVQAAGGTSRRELQAMIKDALRAWPKKQSRSRRKRSSRQN